MTGGELVGKQLQILKEVVSNLSRVALVWNPTNSSNAPQFCCTLRRQPGHWESAFIRSKSVNLYPAGTAHSIVVSSARGPAPWRAVQQAAWGILRRESRAA